MLLLRARLEFLTEVYNQIGMLMLSAEPPNLDLEALELRKTLVFQADITTEDFFFLLAENEKKEEEEEKKPGSQCLQMVSTQLGNRDHCCHPIIQ